MHRPTVFMSALPVDIMEPEDISAVVAFLAPDDSRYITVSQVGLDCSKLNG
jgi:hypothetical protein